MSNITRKRADWCERQYKKRRMYLLAYYQANREKKINAAKEYYQANKDRLAYDRKCKVDIKSAYDKARYMKSQGL